MLCISIINLLIFPVISSFKGRFHDNTLKRHRAQLSPLKIPPLATATYSSSPCQQAPFASAFLARASASPVPKRCLSTANTTTLSQKRARAPQTMPVWRSWWALKLGRPVAPNIFIMRPWAPHRASWKCNRSSLILMYGTTFPMAAGS